MSDLQKIHDQLMAEAKAARYFRPLDTQVGGDHYKKMAIQPVQFITANSIPFLEANVIKYVCRHGSKNGKADLEKAIHYLQLAIDLYYPAEPPANHFITIPESGTLDSRERLIPEPPVTKNYRGPFPPMQDGCQ